MRNRTELRTAGLMLKSWNRQTQVCDILDSSSYLSRIYSMRWRVRPAQGSIVAHAPVVSPT